MKCLVVTLSLASCRAPELAGRGAGPGLQAPPSRIQGNQTADESHEPASETHGSSVEPHGRSTSTTNQVEGFSTFVPDATSRVIHVSSSEGSDELDGTSPSRAVKTLAKGASLIRDGEYDFLLLKRGDTFRDVRLGAFKSGASRERPLVLSSYGSDDARPVIELTTNFIDHHGLRRDHVALLGLEFVAVGQVPEDPAFTGDQDSGLRLVGGGTGWLIEDCHFVHAEIVVQSYGGHKYSNLRFRRNIVERAYHVNTCGQNKAHRPSGIYMSKADDVLIEENLFDHNGWNEDRVKSACATMYNHNLYLNANRLTVRGNLIFRASSMGIKMRSDQTGGIQGLTFEDNLFVDGEIGLSVGGNKHFEDRFIDVTIRNNVFSEVGASNPTDRNFAWLLDLEDNSRTLVEGNYFLHTESERGFGLQLRGKSQKDVRVQNNLFYSLAANHLLFSSKTRYEGVRIQKNRIIDPKHDACLVTFDEPRRATGIQFRDNAYLGSKEKAWFCLGDRRVGLEEWVKFSGEKNATTFRSSPSHPHRTVATYAKSLGAEQSVSAFLSMAMKQSRLSFRKELTAPVVNEYLRAGFE